MKLISTLVEAVTGSLMGEKRGCKVAAGSPMKQKDIRCHLMHRHATVCPSRPYCYETTKKLYTGRRIYKKNKNKKGKILKCN